MYTLPLPLSLLSILRHLYSECKINSLKCHLSSKSTKLSLPLKIQGAEKPVYVSQKLINSIFKIRNSKVHKTKMEFFSLTILKLKAT